VQSKIKIIKKERAQVMEQNETHEYQLAKAIISWLVAIKMLTPGEAKQIDELNKRSFGG